VIFKPRPRHVPTLTLGQQRRAAPGVAPLSAAQAPFSSSTPLSAAAEGVARQSPRGWRAAPTSTPTMAVVRGSGDWSATVAGGQRRHSVGPDMVLSGPRRPWWRTGVQGGGSGHGGDILLCRRGVVGLGPMWGILGPHTELRDGVCVAMGHLSHSDWASSAFAGEGGDGGTTAEVGEDATTDGCVCGCRIPRWGVSRSIVFFGGEGGGGTSDPPFTSAPVGVVPLVGGVRESSRIK
jgi:hypothetical protein